MISTGAPRLATPTVPKSIPVSQIASAQPSSDCEHRVGAGVGGEVEIGLLTGPEEPAEQRVAHAAADQVEPVPGARRTGPELVGHGVDRDEVHRGILLRTRELGGNGGEGTAHQSSITC